MDQNDRLVFRKEILSNAYGEDSKIPAIFTSKKLLKPIPDDEYDITPLGSEDRIIAGNNDHKVKSANQTGSNLNGAANYETEAQSDAPNKSKLLAGAVSGNISGIFSDKLS